MKQLHLLLLALLAAGICDLALARPTDRQRFPQQPQQ